MKTAKFWYALLWTLALAALLSLCAARFEPGCIKTDMQAMLAETESSEKSLALLRTIGKNNSGDVHIIITNDDWQKTEQSALIVEKTILSHGLSFKNLTSSVDIQGTARTLLPWRENFATEEDLVWLEQAGDKQILARAMKRLYRPVSVSFASFENDPLGLFSNWFSSKFSTGNFETRGKWLTVADPKDKRTYILLTVTSENAVSANTSMRITNAVSEAARAAEAAVPGSSVTAAGVPLISERTASSAAREGTIISSISAIGIAALCFFVFRSITPILTTITLLALSCATAFAATLLVFGEIHAITLVFGATLLGVCVDYILHYLCALPNERTKLLYALFISLLSTVVGYALMIFSPMPGLKQMAVFCIAGLVCTFISVALLIPAGTAKSGVHSSALGLAARCNALPSMPSGKPVALLVAACMAALAATLPNLKTGDELRLLNSIPQELLDAQARVYSVVNPTSPGQMFAVQGNTDDETVSALHALAGRLQEAAKQGTITGFVSPASLTAPLADQQKTAALVSKANARALELVTRKLRAKLPPPAAKHDLMTASDFRSALAGPLLALWPEGPMAAVSLSGVTPESLPALKTIANEIPGVSFVNTTADISRALSEFRVFVAKLICAAIAAISVLLYFVYGKKFWRYVLPTALALAATVMAGVLSGGTTSLFTLLPIVLLIGLGIDYAVILYSGNCSPTGWLSVILASCSTVLAFGLLGFSSTAALHSFGATLFTGICFVLGFTVILRPEK